MKVIDQLADFEKPEYAVITIGTFDGVHLGHEAILKRVVAEAKKNKGKSILITFWPHPRFILNNGADTLRLLSTFEEKAALVADLGVDYILKVAFTPAFSNLTAHEFVQQTLVDGVGTRQLFIGHDHHFGNNREGNIAFLKKHEKHYGYKVNEISKQEVDSVGISSTKIRTSLEKGDIQLATSLLGRYYSISGEVVDGNKKGRTIGFPTANVKVNEQYKLLPADGVYAVRVSVLGHSYNAMLNIGFKPTVSGAERTIEVHLFNFDSDIYGKTVTISFVEPLRKEQKFENIAALKRQLAIDKRKAEELLNNVQIL